MVVIIGCGRTWIDQQTAPAVPRMFAAIGLSIFLCPLFLLEVAAGENEEIRGGAEGGFGLLCGCCLQVLSTQSF